MQSPEYPDLPWAPPRGWGSGRDGKAVRYIVIHYTAGSERSTSAEDGAVFDQRRTDGTSTHYFVDRDSIVQCVRTADRANAAKRRGNRLGIQYELCGTAQSRAQWLDEASLATLQRAARQVARDCRKYGIPARRLSVAETRRAWTDFPHGPKGIVGHIDCTMAYPEDGGDHTDPGPRFPWDVFLGMVQKNLDEGVPVATQFNADDKAELRKAAESITTLINHAAGGGQHSDVADAILNASYPVVGTTNRTLVWQNLQHLHRGAVAAEVARDGAAVAALNAGNALAAVGFLADDFPSVADPEADPIVKRIRWVLAHPVT